MSNIRKKTIQGLKVGDSFTVEREFNETDMLSFSTITRDYNPVHFDQRFSNLKNFNDRICHGLFSHYTTLTVARDSKYTLQRIKR